MHCLHSIHIIISRSLDWETEPQTWKLPAVRWFFVCVSYSLAKSAAWKSRWLRRGRRKRGRKLYQVRLFIHQLFLNNDIVIL